jgi:hypothetical protein
MSRRMGVAASSRLPVRVSLWQRGEPDIGAARMHMLIGKLILIERHTPAYLVLCGRPIRDCGGQFAIQGKGSEI